jgi:hypothetical protein
MSTAIESLGVEEDIAPEAELTPDHIMSPDDRLDLEVRNEQAATRVMMIAPLATAAAVLLTRRVKEPKFHPAVVGLGLAATFVATIIKIDSRQAQGAISPQEVA